MREHPRYTLVTPARNEAAYIEDTIKAVMAQTVLPEKWVIVSDGSTDRTDEIVKGYEKDHDFVQLLRRESDPKRDFGSKVYTHRAGVEQLKGVEYDYLGNLDADVTFEPDYYEQVLEKMELDPEIAICGGTLYYHTKKGRKVWQHTNPNWSVSGPIQLFRRKCYEEIGGFFPLRLGGEDATAELMCRMKGWKVRAFPSLGVHHLRPTGTVGGGTLSSRVRLGKLIHSLGFHPVFAVFWALNKVRQEPYVIGAICIMIGCWGSVLRRRPLAVPEELVQYRRKEHRDRLKALLRRLVGRK
ncbi:glycosyltransferase [Candidatus Hydrogenedentota bacterium]